MTSESLSVINSTIKRSPPSDSSDVTNPDERPLPSDIIHQSVNPAIKRPLPSDSLDAASPTTKKTLLPSDTQSQEDFSPNKCLRSEEFLLQTELNIQHKKLIKLQEQIYQIDLLLKEYPHTIRILGIHLIREHVWCRNVQDKIYKLFNDANIPLFYIVEVNFNLDSCDPAVEYDPEYPADENTTYTFDSTTPVYVTLTNYYVKERTIELLNDHFDTEYDQNIKVFSL
jgi:hypothetical protein